MDEWELKTSIGSEGIQLYGTPGLQAYERHILFTVELPKDHNAYLRLTRALFGRTEPGISAKGLVYDCDGKKISPASFTIPLSTRKKITDFLKEKKIHYSMQEVAFLA